MVKVAFNPTFKKAFGKITDTVLKEKIIRQIQKIRDDPNVGKPMMYARKGIREVYIKPYRLSYAYLKGEDKLVILEFYHKDEQ